jgi:MSHA biogenesis protein MshQ
VVGPVGGQIGTLTAGSFTRAKCASPASSGEVCDTALAWTEVGALLLSAATANGSGYLGSAKVPWGSVATGPFKPSFLTTELDTAQPCGTFTYSGQPFRIKVNAMSAANAVLATSAALTQNYTGAYAKDITLGSDSAGVCTPTTTGFSNNTLLGTAFPANTGFASSAPVTNTVAPLPVTYTQSLAAPAVISVCAKDTDAVNSHGQTQAVLAIRNGRLRLLNAYGSELLPLRVPVRVEYFNGTTWALNTADNCTSLPANTIVLSGGISGNTSASVVALTAGSGTLILTKPSPVATGSVDLAANLGAAGTDTSCNAATPASTAGNLQWLQFPWCAGKLDPNARAKFGSPRAPYIYLRERY